jgi:hypothetical protein
MSSNGIKTGEKFEFEGFWWVPPSESAHVAQGTLRYSPSDGVTLSVVDLHGSPEKGLNGPSTIPVLHGKTLKGRPCTLLNLTYSNTQAHLPRGHSQEVLGSNFLLHGAHISSLDDLSISRARIDLRGLGEWLTEPWPGRETSFASLAEEGVLKVPLDGTRLLFQEERYQESKRFSKRETTTFSAVFEFDHPTTLAEFNESYVRPLHDLLVLGTNEEIRVTGTTILESEELEKWWGDRQPIQQTRELSVVLRSELTWHAERKNAFRQVPLPLAALSSDPVSAIQRWYMLRAELAGVGNSLFATLNKSDRTLEVDLLSLLSCAEGYHRARFDAPVVPVDEHGAAVEAMIKALPDNLKHNYEKRLAHANEQTQGQRLRKIFENAESVVPAVHKWRKVVNGLIQTRNYLTHWGDESDAVLSIGDQISAFKKLEIVLRINLMRDMGVDPPDIQASVNVSHGEQAVFAG